MNKCPICNNKMKYQSWIEEVGLVETRSKCNLCGFTDNWAYGMYEVAFGRYGFRWTYETSENNYLKIQKAIRKYTWKHRKRLLRLNVIKGRGNMNYFKV